MQALDQIVQTQAGGNVRLRKRPIGDGEVREIYIRKQGILLHADLRGLQELGW